MSDKEFLPDNSFTYISDAHSTCTWIDHCICSSSAHNSINSIKILYDHLLSDHHPLTVCFNGDSLPKFHQFQFYDSNPSAHRKTASGSQLLKYCKKSACSLSRVVSPVDVILCTNVKCSEPAHRKGIEDFNSIVSAWSSACSVSLTGHKKKGIQTHSGLEWLYKEALCYCKKCM